jgi:hypothetical protein
MVTMLRSDPLRSESPGVPESEEISVEVGDDDALILWMLSLTPTQRLEAAQGLADSVMALCNGDRTQGQV